MYTTFEPNDIQHVKNKRLTSGFVFIFGNLYFGKYSKFCSSSIAILLYYVTIVPKYRVYGM